MEKNCKIYKIIDNTNGDCYIGSTIETLKVRLCRHKSSCNYVKKCTSSKIINNGDYNIELIEDIGIVTKEERSTKERYYIENNQCINKHIPGRTPKEYMKEYYRNRTDKQEFLEKQKEKFTCECGGKYSIFQKLRHYRTKKHIDYLNTIN